MTAPTRPFHEILGERTALVAELTRLNAELLRHSQRAGGLEVELLTRRRELETGVASDAARRSLDEAHAREARNKAEHASCEAALAALATRLEALDRELAGS